MDKKSFIEGYRRLKYKFIYESADEAFSKATKVFMSYINYFLKRHKYSQNLIFITGLGKSGSTWTCNLLSSLDGFNRFIPFEWNNKTIDLFPLFLMSLETDLQLLKGIHGQARVILKH